MKFLTQLLTAFRVLKVNEKKTGFSLIMMFFFPLVFGQLLSSCASAGFPSGGPKDLAAPVLLNMVPQDQSVSFQGKVLTLVFDEWVEVDNIKQNLQITPSVSGDYDYEIKKNILTLTFKEDFESNTTYTFNFGESLRDLTEKNKFSGFGFAFSTGNQLDTISLSGNVMDYFKNKSVKGATIALYRASDTTDIDKHKPYYFGKSDSLGNYIVKNIKAGRYRAYAISEPKPDMKYNNTDDLIAFLNDTLRLIVPAKNVNFNLVRYDTRKFQIKSIKNNRQTVDLRMNKVPLRYAIEFRDKKYDSLIFHSQAEDFITFYHKNREESDTVFAKLTLEDSLNVKIDTLIKFKFNKVEKPRKIAFSGVPSPTPSERLEAKKPFLMHLRFNKPVLKINIDTAFYKLDKDSVKNKMPVFLPNFNRSEWTAEMNLAYTEKVLFQFPKGSFIGIENDTLAELKVEYGIIKAEDYGILGGFVLGRGENFIVQIIDEMNKVEKEHIGGKKFKFELLKPGKKLIRVISDTNGNGKWDNGSFKDRIQPEKITFYPEEINLKANWEMLDFGIDVDSDGKKVIPEKK